MFYGLTHFSRRAPLALKYFFPFAQNAWVRANRFGIHIRDLAQIPLSHALRPSFCPRFYIFTVQDTNRLNHNFFCLIAPTAISRGEISLSFQKRDENKCAFPIPSYSTRALTSFVAHKHCAFSQQIRTHTFIHIYVSLQVVAGRVEGGKVTLDIESVDGSKKESLQADAVLVSVAKSRATNLLSLIMLIPPST